MATEPRSTAKFLYMGPIFGGTDNFGAIRRRTGPERRAHDGDRDSIREISAGFSALPVLVEKSTGQIDPPPGRFDRKTDPGPDMEIEGWNEVRKQDQALT